MRATHRVVLACLCLLGGAASTSLLTLAGCASPTSAEPPRAEAHVMKPRRATPAERPRRKPHTVLWVGGDVLLSPAIIRAAEAQKTPTDPAQGWSSFVRDVSRFWRSEPRAAVAMNLESPVATLRIPNDAFLHTATDGRRVKAPLNAPSWLPHALHEAGVTHAVVANNHALDQTREGLKETLDAVRGAALSPLGGGEAADARTPTTLGEAGARVAVHAFYQRIAPEPALADSAPKLAILDETSLDELRASARTHDAVVAIVHVEGDLYAQPSDDFREWPARLVSAGADVVIVHGPHVVQRVARLGAGGRRGVVAWSVGNFFTGMGVYAEPLRDEAPEDDKWHAARTAEGLVARIDVAPAPAGSRARADVSVDFLPVFVLNDRPLVEDHLRDGPFSYRVVPLAACGRAFELDASWPEPARTQTERWLDTNRTRLLARSGLASPACVRCAAAPSPACDEILGHPQLLPAPE